MKKNIFYLFAHQDDEFGAYIDISNKIKNNNVYIVFLTSGYNRKIIKSEAFKKRQRKSSCFKKIGVKKKYLFFR